MGGDREERIQKTRPSETGEAARRKEGTREEQVTEVEAEPAWDLWRGACNTLVAVRAGGWSVEP